jgi:hypothetical protein
VFPQLRILRLRKPVNLSHKLIMQLLELRAGTAVAAAGGHVQTNTPSRVTNTRRKGAPVQAQCGQPIACWSDL